jgi:hypothetical protein
MAVDPNAIARKTLDRATDNGAVPSAPGNPGTLVGLETIDGQTYARFRATRNTWVSSSLKQLGYDSVYGPDSAYGAYRGVARSTNGSALTHPDNIKPGDEYLIPLKHDATPAERSTEHSPARVPPSPAQQPREQTYAGPPPPEPQKPSPGKSPGLRQTPRAASPQRAPVAPEAQFVLDADILLKTLRRLIASGLLTAAHGRQIHEEYLQNIRGTFGLGSEWYNDIQPPYIGGWTNAANFFLRAKEALDNGSVAIALTRVIVAYRYLFGIQTEWDNYIRSTIEGAGNTVEATKNVRDVAAAIWVALATRGMAMPAFGAVASTGLGGAVGVSTLSGSKSQAGEAVRGTWDEIERAGVEQNLKLAKQGLTGLICGTGEGLSNSLESAKHLLDQAGKLLETLFTDPAALARDIARLPEIVSLIFQALNNRWDWLKSLPPERQAFEVGRISGHIEAVLMVLQLGDEVRGAIGRSGSFVVPRQQRDQMILQLVDLRAQMIATTNVAVAIPVAAMAVSAGGPPPAGTSSQKKIRQLKPGEVTEYREFGRKGRENDNLEGHELLQNLWLEIRGLVKERGKGIASRWNPSVALDPKLHDVVDVYQQALRLFDRAYVSKLSVKGVLVLNATALRLAGIPDSTIEEILDEALEHAIFSLARK